MKKPPVSITFFPVPSSSTVPPDFSPVDDLLYFEGNIISADVADEEPETTCVIISKDRYNYLCENCNQTKLTLSSFFVFSYVLSLFVLLFFSPAAYHLQNAFSGYAFFFLSSLLASGILSLLCFFAVGVGGANHHSSIFSKKFIVVIIFGLPALAVLMNYLKFI